MRISPSPGLVSTRLAEALATSVAEATAIPTSAWLRARRRAVRCERAAHHPDRLAQRQPLRQLRSADRAAVYHRLRRRMPGWARRERHTRPDREPTRLATPDRRPEIRQPEPAGRPRRDGHSRSTYRGESR